MIWHTPNTRNMICYSIAHFNVCVHSCTLHTHTYTHTHTHIHTHTHTYTHIHTHTHTHTHTTQAHSQAHVHARVHTHIHVCTCVFTRRWSATWLMLWEWPATFASTLVWSLEVVSVRWQSAVAWLIVQPAYRAWSHGHTRRYVCVSGLLNVVACYTLA